MHLEAADQALPDDLDTLQKHLDRARGTARTSLEQARRVVNALRPHSLDQRSLPDAIQRTAVRWQEETGIPLTTTITGDPIPLHPDIEVTLLRATQEALANIRKHAGHGRAVTLSYIDDVVVLDVRIMAWLSPGQRRRPYPAARACRRSVNGPNNVEAQ